MNLQFPCVACGKNVTYQGTFSLWWDWKSQAWTISGARCYECLHAERLTNAPQAGFGMGGATLGTHQRPRRQAGELVIQPGGEVDNVAKVAMIKPDGTQTGMAEAVVRRVEMWRPGRGEGESQQKRPFKVVLWLEASDFFPDSVG